MPMVDEITVLALNTRDNEVNAILILINVLNNLQPGERDRVIMYVATRYGVIVDET